MSLQLLQSVLSPFLQIRTIFESFKTSGIPTYLKQKQFLFGSHNKLFYTLLSQICWDLINALLIVSFQLYNSNLNFKGIRLRHQWLCCMINTLHFQQLGEMFFPPNQYTVGVCKQATLLILYFISSRLVNFLKSTDVPIQVPDIFNLLLVSCSSVFAHTHSVFCSSFQFHVLHCLDYLHCFCLDPVTTAFQPVSFDLTNLNIIHHSMVYVASIHTDLDSFQLRF